MPKLKLLLTQLCVCAALTTFFGTVRAQQVSLATNRSGKPPFEGLSLTGDDKRKIFFNVRKVGSIKGRTFSDPQLADNVSDEYGIAGVKVTLRSVESGFGNFVIEQYTNDAGVYYFEDLPPGRYSIEIVPADLPAQSRISNVAGAPVGVRALTSSNVNISRM